MKTLLINPRYRKKGRYLPLGLAYIASVLEQSHDVRVIDNNVEDYTAEMIKKKIRQISPEIIGITSDSLSFNNAEKIAALAKVTSNEIKVVIGGAHSNVWPRKSLQDNCFDICIYGEGEVTAPELWGKLEKGDSIKDVRGIAYKKDGKIIVNKRRKLIKNLDELPFPARHLFPVKKYSRMFLNLRAIPTDTISSSRGCPYSCNYCSNNIVYGKTYRFRLPKNIVDEIEHLIDNYGTRSVYFRDEGFTISKDRVIGICNELRKRRIEIEWACESRVDSVDKEMLVLMGKSGCRTIWFGVESGSQKTLEFLNKQITIDKIRKTFEICKKVGLSTGASFMIGVPGETIDDMHKTINFAHSLKPDFFWFNIFWGIPSSPIYKYIQKNKLYSEDIGGGVLLVKTNEFDRELMEKIQKRANRKMMGPFLYYRKKFSRHIPISIKVEIAKLIRRFSRAYNK